VAGRLKRWNGVTADVLHPPRRPGRTDVTVRRFPFFPSRLTALKRADSRFEPSLSRSREN